MSAGDPPPRVDGPRSPQLRSLLPQGALSGRVDSHCPHGLSSGHFVDRMIPGFLFYLRNPG